MSDTRDQPRKHENTKAHLYKSVFVISWFVA
jgi:hypothetical protein